MLALFSAGYTAGVLRRRHGWTQALGSTNTIVGLIMLVVLLLANSPLLDFRKISLASQIHRVDSGEIELAEFDFRYVKQHLARPGYLYLERLKAEIGDDDPDLLEAIENPIWRIGRSVDPEVFWEQVQLRPKNLDIPPELREAIDALPMYALTGEVLLMPADLDDDGVDEYVLIQLWQDDHGIASAYLFYQEGSAWLHRGLAFQHYRGEEILQTLLQGEITLHDRRFQDLDIGGIRFSVTPHRRSIMDAAAPGPQWLAR